MNSFQKMYRKLETIYWRGGILRPEVRRILVWQTGVVGLGLALSALSCFYSTRPVWFALGAALSLWNLFLLTREVSSAFKRKANVSFRRFFIRVNLRLLLTAFLSYIALAKFGAHPLDLSLGFASLSLTITVYIASAHWLRVKSIEGRELSVD